MLGKICLLFLCVTLLLVSESFQASLLSSQVTAGKVDPKVSITSNVTSVKKGESFALTCKLADFDPDNREFAVYFYQNDSPLLFASIRMRPQANGTLTTKVYDHTVGRHIEFKAVSLTYPVYTIAVKGKQTHQYFCQLSNFNFVRVRSTHINITVV